MLAAGGVAFGVFTASVFAAVASRAPVAAAASVSGVLPTAQQLGGTLGVALAGVLYAAGSLGAAMAYETAVFAVTALATYGLRRDSRSGAGTPA